MSICETCVREKCLFRNHLNVSCDRHIAKPKTNADRIRAMSDEELARQFAHHEYLVAKEVLALFGIDIAKMEYDFEKSAADMLEQLQQPAEGE